MPPLPVENPKTNNQCAKQMLVIHWFQPCSHSPELILSWL